MTVAVARATPATDPLSRNGVSHMANEGNTLVALAVGAGAGYALFHFFGDRLLGRDDKPKPTAAAPPPIATASAPAKPIATAYRCQVRLDAKGLAVENRATNLAGAIAACRAMGSSD